jgi:3-dehydroquinate synthase
MKERLEDRLLALGAHRDSVVVALGGGMIGDLAGFTAATLHRGVPLVQVPTSLLAQVDSSVGGKVAVDHPRGKNLVGAFHQPARVYIDVGALRTLPGEEYRSGLAEVIKYGATMDAKLFALLKAKARSIAGNAPGTMTPIIRRCCDLKRMIVEADERESGLRRILNFGHTIGHAVETLSNYRLRHGYAVAIGMCAEGRIGVALGITGRDSADRLEALVRLYGLPTEIPSRFTTGSILKATRLDKKSFGGAIRYTLLRAIGASELNVVVPERDLRSLLGSLRRR